jgi:hypothetical protein
MLNGFVDSGYGRLTKEAAEDLSEYRGIQDFIQQGPFTVINDHER